MTKITCLGAGSHSFGLSTLITLLQSEVLRGAEISLVDINQESLDLISELANWLNSEWGSGKVISSHSSHQNALNGSDFVISAIEVQPRERLWKKDFQLGNQYGLRQPYAENGGPGGFAHAARNVNTILADHTRYGNTVSAGMVSQLQQSYAPHLLFDQRIFQHQVSRSVPSTCYRICHGCQSPGK